MTHTIMVLHLSDCILVFVRIVYCTVRHCVLNQYNNNNSNYMHIFIPLLRSNFRAEVNTVCYLFRSDLHSFRIRTTNGINTADTVRCDNAKGEEYTHLGFSHETKTDILILTD